MRHLRRSWDVRVIDTEVPAATAVRSVVDPCSISGHEIAQLVSQPWVISAHVEHVVPIRAPAPSGRMVKVDAIERAHVLLADGHRGASIDVFASDEGDASEAAKRLVSIIVPSWSDQTPEAIAGRVSARSKPRHRLRFARHGRGTG